MKINPVILSGGSGTRLWPLSRALNPKQFLSFFGKNSLFADTALRIKSSDFTNPTIICNEEHRFIAASELQKIDLKPQSVILEPEGRNTAPAIATAAFDVIKNSPESDLMLVMPSDHIIKNQQEFLKIVKESAKIAQDHLVTFGVTADHPNTGYGYIKKSSRINDYSALVEKFVEKPDKKTAEGFVATGDYFFNSGIFLFKASKYLEELRKLSPEIYQNCQKSYENSQKDLDFIRLESKSFEKCENISIDYAVMEKLASANKIAVSELNADWDDVGNFAAISKNSPKNAQENNIIGDVEILDTKNCYINSESGLTVAIGVEDLVIVNLKDVTMVANKSNSQDIKKVYQRLKDDNRQECLSHSKVLRPWGSFETMDKGSGFKVKRITVNLDSALSLQMHHKRAEHWIVVRGTATVTCEDKKFELNQGESTFIPLGKKHRLENRGKEPLEIIEVQTGSYLGEDDIVRFDDIYGR